MYDISKDFLPLILQKVNEEPLKTFFYNNLYKEKYYPEKDKIFSFYKKSLKDINRIDVHLFPDVEYNPNTFYISLTTNSSRNKEHLYYWENLSISIIRYISKVKPCVWVFTKETKKYIKDVTNHILVNNYPDEDLPFIPLNQYTNYVIIIDENLSKYLKIIQL
jgi:hypothetical protein